MTSTVAKAQAGAASVGTSTRLSWNAGTTPHVWHLHLMGAAASLKARDNPEAAGNAFIIGFPCNYTCLHCQKHSSFATAGAASAS